MKALKKGVLPIAVLSVVLCSGCCVPSILFPKTGAHGVVLDQFNKPVSGAKMSAAWIPVRFFYMSAPSYEMRLETAHDGTWRFYRRKVENMGIRLLPMEGYELVESAYRVGLYGGQCPTNDFILRLRKIEPAQLPGQVK